MRILEALLAEAGPLDAGELAERVELHPNTVRSHVAVLAEAGLVAARPAPRGEPGRPKVVYEATGELPAPEPGYRFLATILAGSLSGVPGADRIAEDAGRAWGRYLVERPAPFTSTSGEEAVREVVRILDEHGFDPKARDGVVRMRRCPFRDLARAHPEVVCSAHLGLLRGALDALDTLVEVTSFEPFVEPSLCIARLAQPEPGP
jgi:predicted ArsR family transcriptional regulator